jgi:hypothetical protein
MNSSIFSFITPKASLVVGKASLQLSKQSPHLLFGAGIAGFGATIFLASKAVLKLDRQVDDFKHNLDAVRELRDLREEAAADGVVYEKGHDFYYSDQDFRRDMAYVHIDNVLKIGKMYGPTMVVGALTVICLTKSHTILSNRNTALMAAYSVLDKSYTAYRKRVVEEFGEEKDRELRYPNEVVKIKEIDDKGKSKEVDSTRVRLDKLSGYARFFDELCPNWKRNAEYNLFFLRAQQNYANDLLRSRGHVFLNEIYDMIGIDRTQAGAVVGWVIGHEGDNYIDFGIFDGDNPAARDFVNGREGAILLDFNVDGVIYDKIGQ